MKLFLLYREAPASEIIGLFTARWRAQDHAWEMEHGNTFPLTGRDLAWEGVSSNVIRSGLWTVYELEVVS